MVNITETRFDTKKQQIFAAAEQIFSEKGYVAASMNEIAQTVGLAKATLYHYFASKDQLFAALMENHFEGFLAEAQGRLQGVQTLEAIVQQWMYLELDYFERHHGLIRVFFHAGDNIPDSICQMTAAKRKEIRGLVTRFLEPHLSEHLDVEFTAVFLQGTIKAVVLHLWSTGQLLPHETIVQKMYPLLMNGLTQAEPMAERKKAQYEKST